MPSAESWLAPAAGPDLAPVAARLAALAEAEPGREACGLVVSASRDLPGDPEAWPVPNAAPDPRRAFALAPEALLGALRRLEAEGRVLLAVYHSHPGGGADLSARDLDGALCEGLPVLEGVAQVVVALEGGRACTVRAHRWADGRYRGTDLWTSVR